MGHGAGPGGWAHAFRMHSACAWPRGCMSRGAPRQETPYLLVERDAELGDARMARLPTAEHAIELGRRLGLLAAQLVPARERAARLLQAAWRRWVRARREAQIAAAEGESVAEAEAGVVGLGDCALDDAAADAAAAAEVAPAGVAQGAGYDPTHSSIAAEPDAAQQSLEAGDKQPPV